MFDACKFLRNLQSNRKRNREHRGIVDIEMGQQLIGEAMWTLM